MSADPHAAEWRQVAADLGGLAEDHVRAVFAWIDRELATNGSRGAVVLICALADLDLADVNEECAVGLVVGNLLLAADAHMPCAHAGPCPAARSAAR